MKPKFVDAGTGNLFPASGSLCLEGKDISCRSVEKRGLAIAFQDFALFPHLDVTENIIYGIRYHHISQKETQTRFTRLVSTLELEITILMVSHHFPDVFYLANRGAIIKDGHILQQGDILSIFEKPNSRFTAAFVGMKNIHPIDHVSGKLRISHTDIDVTVFPGPDRKTRYMGIRPEEICLENTRPQKFENHFQCRIKEIISHSMFLSVRLSLQTIEFEAVWPRSFLKDYMLEPGKRVIVRFHARSVHTF